MAGGGVVGGRMELAEERIAAVEVERERERQTEVAWLFVERGCPTTTVSPLVWLAALRSLGVAV